MKLKYEKDIIPIGYANSIATPFIYLSCLPPKIYYIIFSLKTNNFAKDNKKNFTYHYLYIQSEH
jgi:hypothetical protein